MRARTALSKLSGRSISTPDRRPRAILRVEQLEDRLVPSSLPTVNFSVTNDWGSGFQAQMVIDNTHGTGVYNNWQFAFDFAPKISSIWDATIVSHVGTHYVIAGASWDKSIAAGGEVSFAFVAAPGNVKTQPANYLLDGIPLGGTQPPPVVPAISVANASVTEGSTGSTPLTFTVNLSTATTVPVTVSYATADGTAHSGSDYQSTSGTLTFAPGQTRQTVTVPVVRDPSAPTDETLQLVLSNPTNGTLGASSATATIIDDAPPAPAGNVTFQVTSDWGSGFQAQITMNNPTNTPINNWVLEFDFAGSITSIWDAAVLSHVGNHYVIENAGYNSTIAADGTMSFGFTGSPGNVTTGPTNFNLHSGTANLPPVAVNVSASTQPGVAVNIPVLANDSDPNGYALTLSAVGAAQHGTVVANSNGSVTYTPTTGYLGTDSFTYTVSDGHGNTATGTVSLTVAAIAPPVASNGSASVQENQAATIPVLNDASDAAGYPLTLSAVGAAQHGTVVANSNGSVTYTPTTGYLGTDSFTYTVSDGHGNTATGTINVTVTTNAAPVWPAHVFAPYVDATDWPIYNFLQTAQTQGTKFLTLAFVVGGPSNEPAWGGYQAYDVLGSSYSANLQAEIEQLRAIGGDVAISFGGANGPDLATVVTSVSQLQADYQTVINTYGVTHLDFDIEGAEQSNQPALNRFSQAVAGLEQANPGLVVSFTLPVLPSGLTSVGLNVLDTALGYGVKISR